MSAQDATPVAHPVTTTAETLTAAAEIINALTSRDHIAQPATVIVSTGRITILPEDREVPIHAMLTWSEHLDGEAQWDAAVITQNPTAAFLTANGTIDGIEVVVSGSTVRVTPEFVDKVRAGPLDHPTPITKMDVLELASGEDVLGV